LEAKSDTGGSIETVQASILGIAVVARVHLACKSHPLRQIDLKDGIAITALILSLVALVVNYVGSRTTNAILPP
jgi:hypothetical protein